MLSVVTPVQFEVPKYELGSEVIHRFQRLGGREVVECGIILGYQWLPTGELELYVFGPHSNKSASYPCQPVEPSSLTTLS